LGRVVVVVLISVLAACGDDDTPDDAATDAGADTMEPDPVPWLMAGEPPIAAPALSPCPTGWHEDDDEGLATCAPYPATGVADCPAGQAHFPGAAGCEAVGDVCPSGVFADDLPASGTVLFVDPAAAAGGDGTRGAPFSRLGDVSWSTLAAGTTVALGKGSHDGSIPLRPEVRVIGACTAETTLSGVDAPVPAVVSASRAGEPGIIRNVTITSPNQVGVLADGDGRQLHLDGVVIEGARDFGVRAYRDGRVTGENVVIRDGLPGLGDMRGISVYAEDGAVVELTRVVIERARELGAIALGEGASVSLFDALVRDTEQDSRGVFGRGVEAQGGGAIRLERALVVDNVAAGVFVDDPGSTAILSDVVIRGTRGLATETCGYGLQVREGGLADVSRTVFEGNECAGILSSHLDTVVTLNDVVVRDTASQASTGMFGRGIAAQRGGRVDATRLVVRRNRDTGIGATGSDTHVTLADARIEAMVPLDGGEHGSGLHVQEGRLDGSGVIVRDTYAAGVAVLIGGRVALEDVSIRGVEAQACAASTCPIRTYGYGAITDSASTLRLERFLIREASLCGLLIDGTASVDAVAGEISDSAIGACIQAEGFDLGRIMEDVRYRDNGTSLDSTSLPIPEPRSGV